jgi:hypothetical protein
MSRIAGGALKALRAYAAMQRQNLGTQHVQRMSLAGPGAKAWLANGLDELRQAVQPAFATQVGAGPATAYGVPTQGQITAARDPKARGMERE